MEKNLSRNYREVNLILNLLGNEYKNKVPNKMKLLFEKGEDKTYSPEITIDDFFAGRYLEDTKIILSILYINYWSKVEQKNQYMSTLRQLDEQYKEENKLVLNEIFPKREYKPIEPNNEEKQIVEKGKNSFSQKIMEILERLKNIFKK